MSSASVNVLELVVRSEKMKALFVGCPVNVSYWIDSLHQLIFPSSAPTQLDKRVEVLKTSVDDLFEFSINHRRVHSHYEMEEYQRTLSVFGEPDAYHPHRGYPGVNKRRLKNILDNKIELMSEESKKIGKQLSVNKVREMCQFVAEILGTAGVTLKDEFRNVDKEDKD